jgi:DNA repair protein RecN (Recombination protein N)
LATCQNVTAILDNDDTGILKQLHTAANQIAHLQKITPRFNNTVELLQQAIIQVTETNSDLHSFLEQADLDPQELYNLEQRLSAIHALARKLKVNPELLNEHFQTLCSQYELLVNANTKLLEMEQKLQLCLQEYQQAALKLHESRMIAAKRLAKEIIAHLKNLELTHAKFEVLSDFNPQQQPSMNGLDQISFMVSANPGQPLGPLKKIASGGELSRISLAIQAISAQRMATPTLILDEVDVGISGKTAAAVGHMMRELAKQAQILCITHLPQVAALGSVHFKVTKTQTKDSTSTAIIPLNRQARVQELARLLGGISITPEALAHAESMLAVATP